MVNRDDVMKVAGEPVAWRFKSPLGFQKVQINKPIFSKNEDPIGWSALYTSSQILAVVTAMECRRSDEQLTAFREWYNAQWLGDQGHGQYIPHNGDPKYTEYLDGHALALGAWLACLQHNGTTRQGG